MANATAREAIQYVNENEVQFIRLAFSDMLGVQKNVTIFPSELPYALEKGVAIDANGIGGFGDETVRLVPDPGTLSVMPWRPGPGRVVRLFCDICDGNAPSAFSSRNVLKNALKKAKDQGVAIQLGVKTEFYLFKTDEDGEPFMQTLDNGGYLDISPLDKGENIRREICLNLQEMGLTPERSMHKRGPGQNEIDFKASSVLSAADNYLAFKSVVKAIAARNGLFASFMPKPIPNQQPSGLHLTISVQNPESFAAGILEKARESAVVLNPLENSYDRLASGAPSEISWSTPNSIIRVADAIELRSADPAANPYLAFALVIEAGLLGLKNNLKLPTQPLGNLPKCLGDAADAAKASEFLAQALGAKLAEAFVSAKIEEAAQRRDPGLYFPLI
ncbi:MAG: glutamine synthetase family protein [Clostridiales bacterium]|jgi:glutamine synthetase|nr:glutamine synthetase family protein [Clostridiales bacterium]